jgi:hypothetical protein
MVGATIWKQSGMRRETQIHVARLHPRRRYSGDSLM